MIRTPLCDRFGIEYPILNAPMGGGDAPGRLAAAVSEAGGLGMIGGTSQIGEKWVRDEVRAARDGTDRPFGIGFISFLPNAGELMDVALDEGVRIIAHSFGDATPYVARAHDAGALVLWQVRTVEEARRAVDAGADVVTAQGSEAGGHTGVRSTLPLVPEVVDAIAPVPVIAAGGIADGRGIAAALVLGADAVWIGTRFLATHECGVSDDYKARVLAARGSDTVLTSVFDIAGGVPWPPGIAGRALRTEFTNEWHGREDDLRATIADGALPTGEDYRAATWAGEDSTFVTKREPAGDLVRALVSEATDVLSVRAEAVLNGNSPSPT
jgi:nitronate monooxygenase